LIKNLNLVYKEKIPFCKEKFFVLGILKRAFLVLFVLCISIFSSQVYTMIKGGLVKNS